MKKRILIIVTCIVLVVSYRFIKEYIENQRLTQYDFVFGVNVFRDEFTTDHYLYGYKNGKMTKIGNIHKKDMTNLYRVTGTNKIATYFDYNTWIELYKKTGSCETDSMYGEHSWGICQGYENIFMSYYNDYKYDIKDKMIFDDIINCVLNNHENKREYYHVRDFFINKNNYYISMFEDGKDIIYQYDINSKTLKMIFELPSGAEIEYYKSN